MALKNLANYVLETANNPGTGTVALAGAVAGRRSFAQAFTTGSTVFYFIDDGTNYECGIGTFTTGSPNHLARTTIIETSSGGTTAINFTGTVNVYCEAPAQYNVVVTDFALTGAGSGVYLQLPASNPASGNRALLQGGLATTGAGGTISITFPLAFPNTIITAQVTTAGAVSANSYTQMVSVTSNSVMVLRSFLNGVLQSGTGLYWFVWGY